MFTRISAFALITALISVQASASQFPMVDAAAQRVIQKYQSATCEELWQARSQPKPPNVQEAIQLLQSDPMIREIFMSQVAVTVANKMFECGLLP